MSVSLWVLLSVVLSCLGFSLWFVRQKFVSIGFLKIVIWLLLSLAGCLSVWVFVLVLVGGSNG